MAKRATGGITITGTIDGTSVMGEVAVINGPLLQYYDGASVKPDWAAKWADGAGANLVPICYPKMHDSASGADLTGTVSLTRITYNDADIQWGNDGKSTSPSLIAGRLLKTTMVYPTASNPNNTIEVVKFIGNPAQGEATPDDDRIAFYGSCSSGGGRINFQNVGKAVEIRRLESTERHDIYLTVPENYESYISRQASGVTKATRRLASLMKNGEAVSVGSMSGYEFRWADITDKSEKALSNGNGITISTTSVANDTITIDAAAVDSMMLLRCRCYDGSGAGAKVVATAVVPVFDLSDELQVRWKVGPQAGGAEVTYIGDEDSSQVIAMRSGDNLKFRPVVYNRQTGELASAFSDVEWDFSADDNDGVEHITEFTHTTKYVILTHGNVTKTEDGVLMARPIHLSATSQTDVE